MRKIFITTVILIFSFCSFAQEYQPIKKFDPSRNPEQDLKAAIEYAQKSNKRIIIDVGGEWCICCHRIDAFIESHKEIKEFLENHLLL
jgi:thioredoxin-related protein